jgi:hypothetical protein
VLELPKAEEQLERRRMGAGAATSERSPRVLRVVEEPGKEVQDAALGSPRRVAVKVTYKKV